MNAELAIALTTALAGAAGAVAVQLWRLADKLARLDEHVQRSLSCCDQVAGEVVELDKQSRELRDALVRGGLL
jgi:hypothetical protein